MSEEDNERVELPQAAEALLADWPPPDRDALSWDLLAEKTVAAAFSGEMTATDAALFEPPLPCLPEEPGGSLPSADDPGSDGAPLPGEDDEPSNFADIARATVKALSKGQTDADIAREGLSVAAKARRNWAASREIEREDGTSEDTPISSVETVRSHGAPTVAAAVDGAPRAKVVELPSVPPRLSESDIAARRGVPFLIAGALAAAAAIIVLVRSQGDEVKTTSVAAEHAPQPVQAVAPSAPPQAPAPAEQQQFLALDDLPTEPSGEQSKGTGLKAPAAAAASPLRAEAKARQSNAPPSPANVVLEEQAPASEPRLAQGGPSLPAMKPAAQATDIPQRPSTGAVQAAIASVMSGAQMCLAGQEESSKATVTFGSDGRVQSVQVTGSAAGTPAESCIRQKLSAARVPPFAEPSFSARVSVRPQ